MGVYIQERSGQSNCTRSLTHSLTHSILINLFIKLELNNFLLPPLLSIVFVQECSVVFRKVFDEGRLERRTFLPEKWRAWVRVSKIDLGGHCGFTCLQFFFRKYDGFRLSAFAHTKMKADRSSYDCGDVSVTTARSARSKNCYKKARKWDRVEKF